MESLTGYAADDFMLDPGLWKRLLVADDVDNVMGAAARAMEVGVSIATAQLQHRSGAQFRVRARLTAVRGPDGAPARLEGLVWRDDPLHTIQSVIDELPDAAVVVGRDGTIIAANARIGLLGYSPDDLRGRAVEVLVPEGSRAGHPQRRARFAEPRPARPMGRGPFFARTSSGEQLPVDISLGPLSGTDFVIAVLRDLRPIRALEARNRDFDRRFRTTFEQAAMGIVHLAPDASRWLAVNSKACEIIGSSEAELLRATPEALLQLDQSVRDFLLGPDRGAVVREVQLKRQDGSRVWVRMTYSAARTDAGEVEYFVNVIEDIDVRRRTESYLQQAQRLDGLGRMASGIAHDFNNLLSVILSYSESLASDPGLNDEQRAHASEIEATARRAADLTRQLLTFSRHQRVNARALDCEEAMNKLEGLLNPVFGSNISFTWSVEQQGLAVLADPSQFEQVVMNLAVNARDAMPSGGTVSIRVAPHVAPAFVAFEVRDTGTGIPPEVVPHIFEPFFTTKGEGKGTGLGLATVQGIVQQNGGTISVSTGPGGTTFTVLWPAADEAVTKGAQGATLVAPVVLGKGERLLVVEDDVAVRRLVHATLAHAGYLVSPAGNGAEALFLLTQKGAEFDALITDVNMPFLGGVELVSRLASMGWNKPVLFITTEPEAPATVQRRGERQRVLSKPFSRTELLTTVSQMLESSASGRGP
ncbi:MAG: PAS domain S-box protein [Myxococcus sp.]|nr:PAS domain S-box protein [Myxococcus sp.]